MKTNITQTPSAAADKIAHADSSGFAHNPERAAANTQRGQATRSAIVYDEAFDKELGRVELRDEEIQHFDSCGSVPAKIALDSMQIEKLNLDDNDYIYIRRAE